MTPVLKNINLTINAGEKVAIVGSSGAGKSTITNLIPRFYDVNEGYITIDQTDIKDVTIKSLRANIGMVLQDSILFSGTLKENIRYGNQTATEAEVFRAAQAARVDEFVKEFPDGFDTEVGERGAKLSGGQKQRIAIARAFLKNPKILILDEATSALDSESENKIQEALDDLMQGRTTVIIAHRLSTIMNADKIVVLNKGEIAEIGTHNELIARNGVYKHLYDEQFKEIPE
jgi:ABC-type multidrug transport system fused ATPase/permease subunit